MAKTYKNESEFYKSLTKNLKEIAVSQEEISEPDPSIDTEAIKIYEQARKHRELLVKFYITYTVGFTILVFFLFFGKHINEVSGNI